MLYLIEILHQTTTYGRQRVPQKCCILSKFYIKPQPSDVNALFNRSCILSKFYIKPQPSTMMLDARCVVSYRNSTSNHNIQARRNWKYKVVSYRNSTSNHNPGGPSRTNVVVVSYRNSTSNHNYFFVFMLVRWLYLIEILHQTTTVFDEVVSNSALYLIEILHQTTTKR